MSKSLNELGDLLSTMYKEAPKKEQVTKIHLFGVMHADDIQKVGIREVIEQAGIHSTYRSELSKAIKLSKYVIPK